MTIFPVRQSILLNFKFDLSLINLHNSWKFELNRIESDVTLVCYGNNNAQRATDRLCTHIGMVQKRAQIVLKRIEKKIFDDFDRLHEKVKKRRSV